MAVSIDPDRAYRGELADVTGEIAERAFDDRPDVAEVDRALAALSSRPRHP
ncbi:hypothetical protein [Cryobacterium fucosi]|uniref:hypothetical protein n=1 Tax=Cryobacterium fucosi TaxID=1259157 RepID=UPI00141AF162|nr:hypothetical protein [Cryobacterium fucosi]